MKAGLVRTSAIMIGIAIVALAAGTQLNEVVRVSTQVRARESSFAAVQATWTVVEMLRADLQRAGYYENAAPAPGLNVKISHPRPLSVKVASDVMVFHSPDGSEVIAYRFVNGQLTRSTGKRERIALDRIADCGFRRALDGEVINVTIAVGVAPQYDVASSMLCFTGRFRRAEQS